VSCSFAQSLLIPNIIVSQLLCKVDGINHLTTLGRVLKADKEYLAFLSLT
jgi:hypothetical protein